MEGTEGHSTLTDQDVVSEIKTLQPSLDYFGKGSVVNLGFH